MREHGKLTVVTAERELVKAAKQHREAIAFWIRCRQMEAGCVATIGVPYWRQPIVNVSGNGARATICGCSPSRSANCSMSQVRCGCRHLGTSSHRAASNCGPRGFVHAGKLRARCGGVQSGEFVRGTDIGYRDLAPKTPARSRPCRNLRS